MQLSPLRWCTGNRYGISLAAAWPQFQFFDFDSLVVLEIEKHFSLKLILVQGIFEQDMRLPRSFQNTTIANQSFLACQITGQALLLCACIATDDRWRGSSQEIWAHTSFVVAICTHKLRSYMNSITRIFSYFLKFQLIIVPLLLSDKQTIWPSVGNTRITSNKQREHMACFFVFCFTLGFLFVLEITFWLGQIFLFFSFHQ